MCDAMVNESKLTEFFGSSVNLCRAIEVHPCLYDRGNSQYLKRETADAAWEVVAKRCDDTVDSCKVRWRNIRSAYIRSLQISTSRSRGSNRTRDYYLHDELKFYWPHVPIGNSEQVDCVDASNEDEFNPTRRKSTYESVNILPEQSKADICSDDDDDHNDNGGEPVHHRREKEHKQIEAAGKSTKRATPQKAKVHTFYIKQIPKKAGTLILKKHESSETVDYEPEINDAHDTGVNDANDTKLATPKNRVRFKRACKRGIDKTIIRELRDYKHKSDEKRRRTSYRETPDKSTATLDILEGNASIPIEQEVKYDYSSQSNLDKHTLPKASPTFIDETNENENSSAAVVRIDRGVQCELDKLVGNTGGDKCNEDFLNILRPRLEEMNTRQKLKFQMKVIECLIATLEDTADFSNMRQEIRVPKNMPMESMILEELRLLREVVTKQQIPAVQKPTAADAATTTTNQSDPEITLATAAIGATMNTDNTGNVFIGDKKPTQSRQMYHPRLIRFTPDKIVNNDDKKQRVYRIYSQNAGSSSLIATSTSNVGTFIIPRVPDSVTNTRYERANAANDVTKISTTTPSVINAKQISLLNIRPHIMRRYSICGDSPLTNITRESPQQIITTSANLPPTLWNTYTTVTPRRVIRTSTIHQFDEHETRGVHNSDTFLVPRTVAVNTTLTTSTTTKSTSSVARNASSTRSSYIQCMSPKLFPHIQLSQPQPIAIPVVLTSIRTTTPNTASCATGSTTVTATISGQTKSLNSMGTVMTPKVSVKTLLKRQCSETNIKEETAAIFTSDDFAVFPIKTEPLDENSS